MVHFVSTASIMTENSKAPRNTPGLRRGYRKYTACGNDYRDKDYDRLMTPFFAPGPTRDLPFSKVAAVFACSTDR